MEDGEIRFSTKIDDSGIDSGLKKVNKKIKSFTDKLKSSGFGNLGASITGLVSGVSASMKILSTSVKAVTKAVKETTEAYKTQERAEIQLDTAVKNSPLLNGESAMKLKEFASQIQKTTEYGDEYLLPFMAELVNAGRSYEEVTDIIQTATDISASGMMDFGTAVSSLNMTFQGMSGSLGRQISSIKNLTSEELRSGKAIEILKKQFSGTAEEIAKNIGSSEQLKNAMGDLKEEIGSGFEKNLTPMRKFFTELIQGWADAKKSKREYDEAKEDVANGSGGIDDYTKLIEADNERLETLRSTLNTLKEKSKGIGLDESDIVTYNSEVEAIEHYKNTLIETQNEIAKLKNEIADYTEKKTNLVQIEEDNKKAIQEEAKSEEERKKLQEELNKSTEHYNQIIAKRDQTIQTIKDTAKATGEEVDEQAILNAELTAYLEMSTDPHLPTMTQKQLEKVQALVKATKELAIEEEKRVDFQKALGEIDFSDDLKKSEILQNQLDTLDELNDAFVNSATFEKLSADEKMKIWSEYSQKRKKLEKDISDAVIEENEKQKTSLADITSTINDYVSQISSVITSMTELATKHAEDETTVKNAELEKQFKTGIISEKEYYQQKEQIEKESAKKNYQLQMWEWSAGLVQIASSSAQAIANALTMKPATLGITMASVMGGLSAVQLANAIRNKPIAPSFANGGIVGGGAYSTGDNIHGVNLKSGEMVLNQRQQQNLWRMAQGGGRSSELKNNIEIKNYRGNDTKVTPQFTSDGIKILIRESVADDLKNRRLNGALMSAENTMNGIRYE